MPMDLQENKKCQTKLKTDKNHNFTESLGYALAGIRFAFKSERNIRFQMAATILVGLAGWFFGLTAMEWVVVILACTLVLMMEMTNTLAEWTIDLITDRQFHPIAKNVKDVAAGAVLLASFFAVIVGAIVFLPKIIDLLKLF